MDVDKGSMGGDGRRLSREAWCLAALEQVALGGTASISVEGLARRLGVTKGSFYHHFTDRAALIAAALEYWAVVGTDQVIEQLSSVADPRRRLHQLFQTSLADERGPLDAALATSIDDPVVAAVVDRVTSARLDFVTTVYRDLGLAPAAAARRALVAYATYLGHYQLVRALGPDAARRRMGPRYLDELLATLLA